MGRKMHLIGLIIYTIVASIGAKFLNIHWIHLLNSLMLSAILFHILEWKFDWIEGEDHEKPRLD